MSLFGQRAFLLKRFYLKAFGVCLRILHNKSLLSTSCRRLYPSLIGTRAYTRPKVITYLRIRFIILATPMASFLSGLVDVTVTCNVSVASRSCAQARSEKILHCKVSFNFNFNFNFIHSLSIYNYTIASTRV